MHYWYRDVELNAILRANFDQIRYQLREEVIVMAPLGPTANQLIIHLGQERSRHHTARTLLVPYNIGNAHWVVLVIRIGNNNSVTEILYMDSLRQPIPDNIRSALATVYLEEGELEDDIIGLIKQGPGWTQTDGSACGPLTIENLLRAALNISESRAASSEETKRIRRQQIQVLQTVRSDLQSVFDDLKPTKFFQVRPEFNIELFITRYNKIYGEKLGIITVSNIEECWKALYAILAQSKTPKDSIATYLDMAKLFLAHKTPPPTVKNSLEGLKYFYFNLFTIILCGAFFAQNYAEQLQ